MVDVLMFVGAVGALPAVCLVASAVMSAPGWGGGMLVAMSGGRRRLPLWGSTIRRALTGWVALFVAGLSLFVLLWRELWSDLLTYWIIAAITLTYMGALRCAFCVGYLIVNNRSDDAAHTDQTYAPTY